MKVSAYSCFMLSEGRSSASPKAQGFSLSCRGKRSKREGESLCRKEGFCKVQVSPVSLVGDIGDVPEDDPLDKLAFLLQSRNETLDKKVKRNNSKMRRRIITKDLVRGKKPLS